MYLIGLAECNLVTQLTSNLHAITERNKKLKYYYYYITNILQIFIGWKNNFINIEKINMDISIAGTDADLFQYKITHGISWIGRESIAGTDDDLFEYMITHGNSWIAEESMMASNSFLLSSYLVTQKNVQEIIKIEEVSISGEGLYMSGAAEEVVSMSNDDLYLGGAAVDVKKKLTIFMEMNINVGNNFLKKNI